MNTITFFFVQEHANNFEELSMEAMYCIAHENLSLLEKLTYTTLAFFLCLFLFYIFHFKLKKSILAKRVFIIYLMVLMGVGWPITLYQAFLKNLTSTVLLLGFFSLLIINIYLLLIYWINPFIPGEPLRRAQKIWGGAVILITLFNLLLITYAGMAQGAITVQAWSSKYLTDKVPLESLSVDLEDKV